MPSELAALSAIIASGIKTIEETYASSGKTFPSLDDPAGAQFAEDAALRDTTNLVVSAAAQLLATLRPPPIVMLDAVGSMYSAAGIGLVNEANVVEILREAGPQGLHVKDIGKKCGVDPTKLGRVLRYLATRHIFREVSPDVFANNRVSTALDTGKSVEEIQAHPEKKADHAAGFTAIIGHCADECLKSCAHLIDYLLDPATSSSQDPKVTPASRAFNFTGKMDCFQWFETPGNEKRLHRFGNAMVEKNRFSPVEIVLATLDWKALNPGDLVVDVGGGLGGTTLAIAKTFPQLRYVVQDRAAVVEQGKQFWQAELPDALTAGRVRLEAHNFFEPQPIKDAAVFILRTIVHDWPYDPARTILRHLREAAQPQTKLLVLDQIIPYAAPDANEFPGVKGAELPPAPFPLLANLGVVSGFATVADMQMMNMLNAQERTIGEFVELVDGTGWKLDSVNRALGALVFVTV